MSSEIAWHDNPVTAVTAQVLRAIHTLESPGELLILATTWALARSYVIQMLGMGMESLLGARHCSRFWNTVLGVFLGKKVLLISGNKPHPCRQTCQLAFK